ncbi:MAG TPA: ABC transporter ATP-binding protein [Acidimicrobiia bacterium]|nr:ABC transporter ATP-binding protein [Acidimicrobiia bacterium]
MSTPVRSQCLSASLRPPASLLGPLAIALAAMTVLPLVGPKLVSRFVDGAVAGRSTATLLALAGGYLATAVGGQGARLLASWLASRAVWEGTNRLREAVADHTLRLDLDFHARHTPGEMIERVDGDVAALGDFLVAFLLEIVASGLLLLGTLVIVAAEDLRLGAALLVYVALMAAVVAFSHRRSVPSLVGFREAMARHMGRIEEQLAAVEDLRAAGAGDYSLRRYDASAGDVYTTLRRANGAEALLIAGVSVTSAFGTAAVLGLAIVLQRHGALSVGATVALFQYTQLVRQPLERMTDQLQFLQAALAGAGRLRQLLAETPSLTVPVASASLPAGALALELDRVDFAYADDGEEVLAGIDLYLAPGRALGLVGRSGSGKTTIARLLARLYDPTAGAVRLGGVDLRSVDPGELRRRVAVVTQDVVLFDGSLRDNLTLFGTTGADDTALDGLLNQLGLGTWLTGLPDGLATRIGPGGAGLSAGEAQLLAFARAFLTEPGLVILDEASSRLDPATEILLEAAVDRLLAGRTAVVIAHRLSSLDRVDDIAVVDGGRIVETGARVDLLRRPDSRFATLLARAVAT